MVPQFGHAGKDFRHARQWAELWEVAERRGPTLFKGVLTDGDLEGISIFIDHPAVVALDSSDLQQVPVAGQTPSGGIILGRTEDLVPPLLVAGSHFHDLPNCQSVPPFGECLIKLRKVNASIIGVEVQVGSATVVGPSPQHEGHHLPKRFQGFVRLLHARLGEIALAKPHSVNVLGMINASNASAWRGSR